jgi:hypothetical protein
MKRLVLLFILLLSFSPTLKAQDQIITLPLGISIPIPADSFRGPKGDKGDPGTSGIAKPTEEGDFLPILGGLDGESGQVYSSQQGSYKVIGGICFVRVYIQFANSGTINGPLVLKGLPKPIARGRKVQIYGGLVTYFSNPRPDAPTFLVLRAGGGSTFAFVDGITQGGSNPRSGSNTLAEHVLNNLTQFVASFDYFID